MKCPVQATVHRGKIAGISAATCPEGKHAPEVVYLPDRLLHPMRRAGARSEGRWQEISWNDAYAIIAESLSRPSDEHGPEVIDTITGCYHKENAVTATFMFSNLLGTPNVLDANHLCIIPDVIARLVTFGEVIHSDLLVDYKESNCLLIWGANPVETRTPQAMDIFRTRRRGGRLIVVDPRPTATASRADIWLRVRPGADAALALAMLHVIINEKLYDEQFVTQWCTGFVAIRASK